MLVSDDGFHTVMRTAELVLILVLVDVGLGRACAKPYTFSNYVES